MHVRGVARSGSGCVWLWVSFKNIAAREVACICIRSPRRLPARSALKWRVWLGRARPYVKQRDERRLIRAPEYAMVLIWGPRKHRNIVGDVPSKAQHTKFIFGDLPAPCVTSVRIPACPLCETPRHVPLRFALVGRWGACVSCARCLLCIREPQHKKETRGGSVFGLCCVCVRFSSVTCA